MSEMVRRVAKAMAIVDKMDEGRFEYLLPHARAAIEAMREPTNAMIVQGDYGHWVDMIDEALGKK